MEISHEEHTIQPNRVVQFKQKFNTAGVKAVITKPKGFENTFLKVSSGQDGCYASVPKFINSRRLSTYRVRIRVWNDETAEAPPEKPKEQPVFKNTPPPKKKAKHKIGEMVKDWQGVALKKSQERAEIIASKRDDVKESAALKPGWLDGMRVLTADDCDYSRGVAIIQIMIMMLEKHNKEAGIKSISGKKLLCEYFQAFSFSGASTIIGLFAALGDNAKWGGDLGAFLKWYQTEYTKVFSPTGTSEILQKGKLFGRRIIQSVKPQKKRKKPNPGFSIKRVEKIVGDLFTNENTGEPLRVKDLHSDIYQPFFLDDERTRAYTKVDEKTKNAKLVDVVLNTALDPNFFQTRKIEDTGISLAPVCRSHDLLIAQNNDNVEIVSLGAELTYQESEKELEGITPSGLSLLNKRKYYRVNWESTKTFMIRNSTSTKYIRIESPQVPEVSEYSIKRDDLIRCRLSANKLTVWTNGHKTFLTWG